MKYEQIANKEIGYYNEGCHPSFRQNPTTGIVYLNIFPRELARVCL